MSKVPSPDCAGAIWGVGQPRRAKPAQHQDVGIAVIVVVAMDGVEASHDPVEPRLRGVIDVPAPPVRQIKMHWLVESPRSREDIEESVAIKILDAEAPCEPGDGDAYVTGDVGEPRKWVVRARGKIRNEVAPGDTVGIAAVAR